MTLIAQTVESAPKVASEVLAETQKGLGFIPNMYGLMANNPALLDAYTKSYKTFRENSGFTPQEQEIIFLSVAYENECTYCVAAHSFIADKMSKVPVEITDAIRAGNEVEGKLGALSRFSRIMVEKRGNVSEEEISDFLEAGYSQEHILGVVAGIGVKTFSNYFNHIANTPVDPAFSSREWSK
ncbi:carboxymuconolactone decarboxylase family protein [Cytophagales bacterium RKSG123]|nr:carboxymuconolactone decarboxylase family protein [Xanthovirga aplysinae]